MDKQIKFNKIFKDAELSRSKVNKYQGNLIKQDLK